MSLGLGCFDYKQVNMRTKLSVNINKVATIRNARGGNNPDIIKVAKDCEAFGADIVERSV